MKWILWLVLGSFWLLPSMNGQMSTAAVLITDYASPKAEKEALETNARTIPFQLVGGLIFVDAELDGEKSQYILDTGAPTLILNQKNNVKSKNTDLVAKGVSGDVPIHSENVYNFALGSIKKKRISALIADIRHVEKLKEKSIKGLIGMEAIRREELLFDYAAQEITILPRRHVKTFGDYKVKAKIPFRMQKHIPVIKMKISGKTYYFGIDSGAEINLLNLKYKDRIKEADILERAQIELCGLDKERKTVSSAVIKEVNLRGNSFTNMEFVFSDISHINNTEGIELDGILGYPFLSKALFSLDFSQHKMYLWE